jgi:hypothetical protein
MGAASSIVADEVASDNARGTIVGDPVWIVERWAKQQDQEGRSVQKEPSDHGDRHHGSEHEENDIFSHRTRPSHRVATVVCGTLTKTDVLVPSRVSTVIVRTGRVARASPTGVRHSAEMYGAEQSATVRALQRSLFLEAVS